jgi:hypothetical protein
MWRRSGTCFLSRRNGSLLLVGHRLSDALALLRCEPLGNYFDLAIAVCMPRTFKRAVLLMSGHAQPFGGSATTTPAEGVLPVEISRYGGSSLKMTTGELAPGEYAVGHPYGPAVFCFGVD